jgi:hypothetical protein
MLPVVQKLVSLLPRASSLITSKSAPLAARLGMESAKISAKSLATMARNNKVTAAFIAYELYGAGSEIVEEMRQADATLADIIDQLGYTPDEVSDTESVSEIGRFSEEFATITRAADALGGLDNLVAVRKALALSNPTYQLYLQTRELSRNIF